MARFPITNWPPIVLCDQTFARVRLPDGRSGEIPLDQLATSEGNETWNESSRQTSTVEVSGVLIERIDRITFTKSGGGSVTLVLNNVAPG